MDRAYLLEVARRERGLTQAQLAKQSGTSQAALSAYERGLKSPSLKVASRILEAAGFDLNLRVHIDWKEHHPTGIVAFWAPNMLWTVETPDCFATLSMPDFIRNTGMRDWDMRDREQRKGAYEQLIRRGLPSQMIRWMDGALLVDAWDELDLPDPVREVWRWPIRLALEQVTSNALSFSSDTSTASIRGYEPLPPPPPPVRPKQRRTRFDPRPPE
ncbi:helix-turn-helix domain-containing protein [Nocardioides jensenii]|uniref:helix-turn-helix domain-containing protein n=1 Tax=Nocardioides jensenii TaxID=1843 RepID=UPI000AE1DE95|nr:helix-turn-helix transcriptional regulator [Nocardioides jensenii]